MNSILDWVLGREKRPSKEKSGAVKEEFDKALDAQEDAHKKAEETLKASERVNAALRATAAALRLAADEKKPLNGHDEGEKK
jgi:hypothetical protein